MTDYPAFRQGGINMILNMDKDKTLRVTKYSNNYEGENNAENIKILLPIMINGCDIKDCSIYLNFINQDEVGNILDLTPLLMTYNDCLYQFNLQMSNMFTYKAGKIQLWLKIINAKNEMVAKSSVATLTIKPHIETEEIIPEQQLSALESLTIQIGALQENLTNIQEYINVLRENTLLAIKQ